MNKCDGLLRKCVRCHLEYCHGCMERCPECRYQAADLEILELGLRLRELSKSEDNESIRELLEWAETV